jgi:tetratricopeptide (TPR) repeat protein
LHVDSLKKKGAALGMLGRIDESIATLKSAIALMPNDTEAGTNLASALALAGRPDEAVEQCIRTILANPEYAPAWRRFDDLISSPTSAEHAVRELQKAAGRSNPPQAVEMIRRANQAAGRVEH